MVSVMTVCISAQTKRENNAVCSRSTLQKLDERIEEKEEKTTTSGIF